MIWRLLLAHVITDFFLQTKVGINNKIKVTTNLTHSLILLVVSTVFFVDLISIRILLMLLSISVLHGGIDLGKARLLRISEGNWNWLLFIVDQLLHLGSILLALYLFFPGYWDTLSRTLTLLTVTVDWYKFGVFFILITLGGSYFTDAVCKKFRMQLRNSDQDIDYSLKDAGKYIGILERIIVAVSILIGRFELIGFLIAAKSIIRHSENKGKDFTEYYLIGTFTSFLWAGIFTYLYLIL